MENNQPSEPVVVTSVPAAPPEVVQPVIDNAAKVAALEERQGHFENRLFDEVGKIRGDFASMLDESMSGTRQRIEELESKLTSFLEKNKPNEEAIPIAEEAEPVVTETKKDKFVRRNGRKVKR